MAYDAEQEKKPESLARKGEGRMKDDEFERIVRDALAESRQYVDSELSPERARATNYYLGKPLGNEEEGRSQAILTEVRDAVDGMLPSLLRIVHGPEHTVEFTPNNASTVSLAEQMTDYCRYVYEQDNAGFLETLSVLKDGLVRKIGIYKWGWDSSSETKAVKMDGLSPDEVNALAAQKEQGVELTRVVERPDGLRDVELTHTEKSGRAWVKSLPPEEFLYNRQARSIDDATLVAHRTQKTRGQLLAMGVSKKDLDEHAGAGEENEQSQNQEEIARRDIASVGRQQGTGFMADPNLGKATDKITYCEAYLTVDFDGDGIAELRRICTIGPKYYPVSNDPADDRPFAVFTPYPEPHVLLGGSVADRTMDIQKINSSLMRATLDSGSASIFPRTVYVDGQANVADIMNVAIGAPIRERIAGAVRILETPFIGKELIPIMQMMQETIERRTGRNKGAAGLDMDALQSTGKEAVGAVLTGSQEQLEVIARVFCETAFKPMMKGLAKTLADHQPKERVVRLRGAWTPINPASWDLNLDVTVNIALGSTFSEKKIATLVAVAQDQENLLQQLGLSNPATSLPKFLNTRAKILKLQGIPDFESYYNALPPDWQPPPQPAPPPDPEQQWIQAEKEMNHNKTMKELAIKQDELTLKTKQAEWDREFQIQKLATETELKRFEIEAQWKAQITTAQLDAAIQEQATETELAMAAHDQLHDQSLEIAQHEHDKAMDVRAADTADAMAAAVPTDSEGPE